MKSFIHKLFVGATRNIWLQLFRYAFVGGLAFLADYGSLALLVEVAHLDHLLAAAIAFLIGLVTNYVLSISWVFSQHRGNSAWLEFVTFALIGVVGLGLNELIMYVGTNLLLFHYLFSKIVSTGIVFFWNFFARKFILFTTK